MKINSIVKYLVAFEFHVLTVSGLTAPIFAIFVASSIVGGSVGVVGFASAVYMASFSVARLVSAYYVDRKFSERQRIALSAVGTVLLGFCYLLYVFARLPWHIYLLQIVNAVGVAFRYSPFMSLFTRYIDRGQESFEWGINGAVTSLGQALTAAVGGVLVEKYGFKTVFIIVGVFVLIGLIYPYMIYREAEKIKDHMR